MHLSFFSPTLGRELTVFDRVELSRISEYVCVKTSQSRRVGFLQPLPGNLAPPVNTRNPTRLLNFIASLPPSPSPPSNPYQVTNKASI